MSNQEYRPTGFNVLPTVIKNLLIINGIFFLATIVFELKLHIDLTNILGLHYFFSEDFRPYQLITYLFMHGSFAHIFFNMFALWMFGNVLENVWGAKRFLIYYVVCGIGAVLLHYTIHYFEIQPTITALNDYIAYPAIDKFKELFSSEILDFSTVQEKQSFREMLSSYQSLLISGNTEKALQTSIDFVLEYKKEFLNAPVVVGASGSVFGLLLAFGMMFPNSMIYMYFFFPIKAKYFVILYGAIELFGAVNSSEGDNIAHYAHLGGMLFGFILIKIWNKGRKQFY
ncbi:MAG: rhomboid family intramembrane serine protease [Bacteroidetes bacterium]|nr:MAG: rhomboid family intramembrane serine protease [Bacteroidota bacterium]